jgi:aryl-alcohol dehydrogenase-like predicted oxidoreductase
LAGQRLPFRGAAREDDRLLQGEIMEIRNLGSSGLRVSAIGLGCNNFGGRIDLEATRRVIHKALDLGITLFDTADVYGERGGSETVMGQVLGDDRKRIVLASKFGMPMSDDGTMIGGSRRYVLRAVEDSLRRLRTDYIDLYQLHQPDARTPIGETLRVLDDLTQQGKVRYVGCSNLKAWQMVEAVWTARQLGMTGFVSCQDEYSLLVRDGVEHELMPAMHQYGMGLLPYFPLASGLLTGKYRRNAPMPEVARLTTTQRLAERYLTDRNWGIAENLADFAQARGRTMPELAFSWLLARTPVASVIAGATQPSQLEENVKAGDWKLTPEDMAEIDRLTLG